MPVFAVTLLLATTFAAINANQSDKLMVEKCFDELGLTIDSRMINDTWYPDRTNRTVECVDACLLKAYGILKNDGTFELDAVMKLISDYPDDVEVKRRIVETCTSKRADDICDVAHNMIKCMHEEIKKSIEND